MADIEITDEASLEAWLKTRPRRDAEIIAFRAAARVFPLWGRAMEEEWAVEHAFGLFPAQRMMLCLHANLLASDQDLQNSLTFATDQAQQNYDAADFHSPHLSIAEAMASMGRLGRSDFKGAIRRAIEAEHEAAAYVERGYWEARYVETHDSSAVEGAVHLDADQARIGNKLLRAPLWPTPTPEWFISRAPEWFTQADRETRAIWAKDPATWAFWERWWDGVISGDMPFPPDLLRDVALIEDDIWQAGPREVAAAIDRLITARALAMTDNGESVEINPDTGKLRLVGADTLPPDIDRYARRKMAKALALFEGELSNQYRPLDAPMRTIRAALGDIENLPVELFDACASASRMTATLVETQSIPAPEKDPLIGEFVASLRETAADILAADTNTQEILTKRKAVIVNDTLIAHAGDINIVVCQIVVVSEGALERMLPENAAAALNPNAHPDERSDGAYKLAGRIFRIAGWAIAASIGALGAVGAAIDGSHAIIALVSSPQFQAVLAWCLKYLSLG